MSRTALEEYLAHRFRLTGRYNDHIEYFLLPLHQFSQLVRTHKLTSPIYSLKEQVTVLLFLLFDILQRNGVEFDILTAMAAYVQDHGRFAYHILKSVHSGHFPLKSDRLACLSDSTLDGVPFAFEVEKRYLFEVEAVGLGLVFEDDGRGMEVGNV